jgi:hypothetical protein
MARIPENKERLQYGRGDETRKYVVRERCGVGKNLSQQIPSNRRFGKSSHPVQEVVLLHPVQSGHAFLGAKRGDFPGIPLRCRARTDFPINNVLEALLEVKWLNGFPAFHSFSLLWHLLAPCFQPLLKHPAMAQMVKMTTAILDMMNQFQAAFGPPNAVTSASSLMVFLVVSVIVCSFRGLLSPEFGNG